jgi:AcrR family transcriptional regulator
MSGVAATEKRAGARRAGRTGRPPRELAGEVDTRILDAAQRVFLDRGLAGASIDEIAAVAGSGKPTIYARFPGKEALYAAVVIRNVDEKIVRFKSYAPTGTTMEERLTSVAANLLHWALAGDTVDLMRLTIAEGRRFPDLANRVHHMARQRGEDAAAQLLREAAQADAAGAVSAFAPDRLAATTRFFIDLVFFPLILRALMGEKLKPLRAEIEPQVAARVRFFLAGCQHGGIISDAPSADM